MTTTATTDDLLAALQEGYDLVRPNEPRELGRDDDLIEDLGLDSLDFIDVVSVFEGRFSTEVVDAVIDRLTELRTVGELVDAFQAAAARS
jgi:acyl carrier protein